MKLLGYASIALVPLIALFASCNEPPTQPPIDTSGSAAPSGGGAGLPASSDDDAGSSEDGAIDSTANDASNVCVHGTCGGCCLPDGGCLPGQTSAACGSSGNACQTCTSAQTCIATIGCQAN